MNYSEATIEKEIQDKGLNAPRLKPEDIDAAIVDAKYHVIEGSLFTVCVLTLKNGFKVTGESACVSPENFNKEIGEKVALADARKKVWPLEAYLLKERLSKTPANFQERVALERAELKSRLDKLVTFLGERKPGISDEAWDLLMQQGSCMQGYLNVLDKRISLF